MINGLTDIIAHIGYPTHSFKSPMIYNPYFEPPHYLSQKAAFHFVFYTD